MFNLKVIKNVLLKRNEVINETGFVETLSLICNANLFSSLNNESFLNFWTQSHFKNTFLHFALISKWNRVVIIIYIKLFWYTIK